MQAFPNQAMECIHDFELHHSRRPKVLVQTAGHVAGAAYYYQRSDVLNDPWTPDTRIYGVSVHPKYGGWFALRGVAIFPDTLVPDLSRIFPPDIISDNAQRIELLERYNNNWRDWSFRDIIPPATRYSEEQKLYFLTPPKDRVKLLTEMKESQVH